ncbi:MAG: response regulator transcription factor [Ferruginibacter sp.]|nr:response regulator transcription factor [Ferruginibacter sp.]
MLTCYIADDEQHAVDALAAMLKKKFAEQVVLCGSNVKASVAIEEIEALQPDIVFLDVEMPEMSGLDLLKHFPERKFYVIFTTAHEKYALPALKASATDYLVKPLSPQDVYDAIQKCMAAKKTSENKKPAQNKITLPVSQELLIINTDDIIHIEAHNNYSHFYFTNRPKLIVCKTLGEYDTLLSDQGFYRVHQSHLINLNHVESVNSNDGDFIMLTDNHRVEISRRKKSDFLRALKTR